MCLVFAWAFADVYPENCHKHLQVASLLLIFVSTGIDIGYWFAAEFFSA